MRKHHTETTQQLSMLFAVPDLEHLRLLDYWQAAVEKVGASSIKDAICTTYRHTDSIAQAARILNFSETTIRRKLHLLREPVKHRGGNNNPYGRKGKPRRKSELLRLF